MKKVVFLNNLSCVKEIFNKEKGRGCFVVFEEDKLLLEVKSYLNLREDCHEIRREDIFLSKKESFSKVYSRAMTCFIKGIYLDEKWGLNCLSKSPIATSLVNSVIYILGLVEILKKKDFDFLLVLTHDVDLYKQIKQIKLQDVTASNKLSWNFNFKERIKKSFPVSIIFIAFRVIYRKLLCKFYLKTKIKFEKEYVVVMSLLNYQCFGREYKDIYFCDFVKYLEKKEVNFVNFMEVCGGFFENIKNIHKYKKSFIVPKEHFVSYSAIWKCLGVSLKYYWMGMSSKNKFRVFDIDCTYLVEKYMEKEFTSTRFFFNLFMFYSVGCLAEKVKVTKYYYPFENRSFEKMAILALRENSQGTRIIGNQHAALSLKHINFYVDDNDYNSMPLPDKIFTTGQITESLLRDEFNLKREIVSEGCALRKKTKTIRLKEYTGNIKTILVILSTDIKEYCGILNFLNEAMKDIHDCRVIIRPHPVIPLKNALDISPFFDFEFEEQKGDVSIEEAFDMADMLLYTSSTLVVEALTYGLPVVYINNLDFLETDPVYGHKGLKWNISAPEELKKVLEEISVMNQESFIDCQRKSREYAEQYMSTVNEECLERILSKN
ncbi:hypothetical protein MNBD_UNCLBAC01-517 [hydrothermal vent metagenome]|uniref:Uncharacterized protein n=1 Tax=hydrothermal vent metagenome TaxID=652676 RepID=A0A3B1E1T6_9ZZZZ